MQPTSVAVSPHHLASQAAIDVMAAGGNAVDGAIACNAVLGVVLPTTCGIGGDLFALVHRPGDPRPSTLNASGRAGANASAAAMRGVGYDEMPYRHPATVTVPGCVDGWVVLLEAQGRLGLAEVLAPAIGLARGGFPVSAELAGNLERLRELIGSQTAAVALYPDGVSPEAGQTLTRPDLAETMEAIASQGRTAFYEGEVAKAIATATGGIVTPADLAANRVEWVEPLGLEVLGFEAWTIPPNSQGYLILATLWLYERLGGASDFSDPLDHHLLIEAYRAAAWDRDDHLADPHYMTITGEELLHELRLFERLERIDAERSLDWPAPSGVPGGTAYMCTIDDDGMGVSLMQSNFAGIGSGIGAGATGIFLHNRGAGFNLTEGHPNELAPGKRPLHTLSPTLWTANGRLRMLLGTRGGHQQPQLVAQMVVRQLLEGMSPEEAQAAPRWVLDAFTAGTSSAPRVEDDMPSAVVEGLRRRGHHVSLETARQEDWGPVAVIRTLEDRRCDAAADPRVSTAAVAAVR
jgi:gamma-glutamyltranspeptidase/glutathione hydrolase